MTDRRPPTDRLDALRALGQQMPIEAPDADRIESVRTALLSRAKRTGPGRGGRVIFALAAAALAAALGGIAWRATDSVGARRDPTAARTAPARPVTVRAEPSTRWRRLTGAPDEVVRLWEGSLRVDVRKLARGERVRVVTGDAEVEVRGTAFQVTAVADRIQAVRVFHGRVEVRREGAEVVWVAPGQYWLRPTEPSVPSAEPPRVSVAAELPSGRSVSRAPAPLPIASIDAPAGDAPAGDAPAPHAPPESPAERAFSEGWSALRIGDALAAADAFGRSAAAPAPNPLAEDATFWRAVALGRARRPADSARALEGFLGRYPGSPRAGEASTMLGWMLLRAGRLPEAEARFRSAAVDPVPRVRESARSGLDEVQRLTEPQRRNP